MASRWFSVHFDIIFLPNRIRITDRKTGTTVDRTAERPFSSEHRLLDDRETAKKFLRGVLREMHRKGSRGRFGITIPIADVTIADGPRSDNDRREIQELLTDAGIMRVQMA